MSIIRIHKTSNYSVISNTPLNDERLSWRAKGIAAYLLTKPDDWRINADHLHKVGREGRDAVRAALKELEEAGYLHRTKEQDEKGRWHTVSVLHEVPQEDAAPSPTPGKPTPGKPTSENPYVGKPGLLLNTDNQVLNTSSHPSDEVKRRTTICKKEKATTPEQAHLPSLLADNQNDASPSVSKDRKDSSTSKEQVTIRKQQHDDWVQAIVPVLYQTATFKALGDLHWRHVHQVRRKLESLGVTPSLLLEWYDKQWKTTWPGTTRSPKPSEVAVGVAAYMESKAYASPAEKPKLVAREEE